MGKVKVNKLECRYPILFKCMWFSTAVWMIVAIVNCFGHWITPYILDRIGMSILLLFAISILACFGKGIVKLVSHHGLFGAFSGRIRRLGVEIVLALVAMIGNTPHTNQMWYNTVVVLIASAFLYDIWRLADFKDN